MILFLTLRRWILPGIILLAVLASGCSASEAAHPAETEASAASGTPLPPTGTPVPPTETLTPTDTATPTISPSPTPTLPPSSTPTATEVPPVATVYGYTVCRYGPGTVYPVHTSFLEATTALVRGRLDDDSWYLIELPETEETCWIFNEIITLDQTAAQMPVLTPPPRPTPAPAPTQTDEEKALGVKYFLVIPDNGGPFACGDGIAYFYSGRKGATVEERIVAALNALFDVSSEYVGQYYNPVYQSSMRAKRAVVENGKVTVWLAGTFVKPKTDCEAARIHLQIWETVSQFPEVRQRPVIWINNVLLGDLLEDVQK